jgi:hypothetical protein
MKVIERCGYGASFNELTIVGDKIRKRCKNDYGLKKICMEIKFYKYVIENKINFPIANIYNFYKDGYDMKYFEGYLPLYKKYFGTDDVYKSLEYLHSHESQKVTKEYFIEQLHHEIETKIIKRYDEIKGVIEKYSYIKHVNGKKILPFQKLLESINTRIIKIVNDWSEFTFVPIHGDCQFNNILTNGDNIVFIDPRGYYGTNEIFGMKEYDYAKVLFAISGYDEFDNRYVDKLDITNENITIELNMLENDIFNKEELIVLLMLNIWLGNAHSFSNNEPKMMYSYFIALYLGTLYFNRLN